MCAVVQEEGRLRSVIGGMYEEAAVCMNNVQSLPAVSANSFCRKMSQKSPPCWSRRETPT